MFIDCDRLNACIYDFKIIYRIRIVDYIMVFFVGIPTNTCNLNSFLIMAENLKLVTIHDRYRTLISSRSISLDINSHI